MGQTLLLTNPTIALPVIKVNTQKVERSLLALLKPVLQGNMLPLPRVHSLLPKDALTAWLVLNRQVVLLQHVYLRHVHLDRYPL
jgi:hypothetical protein